MTRAPSESSQLGAQSPSLPATPVSPRSPVLNHRSPFESPATSPTPFRRSTSPRRGMMDVGFASAVTNICEQAHEIVQQEKRKHKGYVNVVGKRYMWLCLSRACSCVCRTEVCPRLVNSVSSWLHSGKAFRTLSDPVCTFILLKY